MILKRLACTQTDRLAHHSLPTKNLSKKLSLRTGRAKKVRQYCVESPCSIEVISRNLGPALFEFQIKAVERLVVAERENISLAFERQRAEGLARNDEAFEQNLAALDDKAGKLL